MDELMKDDNIRYFVLGDITDRRIANKLREEYGEKIQFLIFDRTEYNLQYDQPWIGDHKTFCIAIKNSDEIKAKYNNGIKTKYGNKNNINYLTLKELNEILDIKKLRISTYDEFLHDI